MPDPYPFLFEKNFAGARLGQMSAEFGCALPFRHVVIDNFPPPEHAHFLVRHFPPASHPVWLDWRNRSPHQYGKQGPGGSENFHLVNPEFRLALGEFNSAYFLQFLERLTGIAGLLPDPYFTGGGMHQILRGGLLDIHTDFNDYQKLGIYRR